MTQAPQKKGKLAAALKRNMARRKQVAASKAPAEAKTKHAAEPRTAEAKR